MYIKKDIPALYLGGKKLWWKEKSYKNFAKSSCRLSQKEYEDIVHSCVSAIAITKKEIDNFKSESKEVLDFLEALKACWIDGF